MMADCFEETQILSTQAEHFVKSQGIPQKHCNSHSNKLLTECYFLTANTCMYIINNSYFKLCDGPDHQSCKNARHPASSIIFIITFQLAIIIILRVVIATVLQTLLKEILTISEIILVNLHSHPTLSQQSSIIYTAPNDENKKTSELICLHKRRLQYREVKHLIKSLN